MEQKRKESVKKQMERKDNQIRRQRGKGKEDAKVDVIHNKKTIDFLV